MSKTVTTLGGLTGLDFLIFSYLLGNKLLKIDGKFEELGKLGCVAQVPTGVRDNRFLLFGYFGFKYFM